MVLAIKTNKYGKIHLSTSS